MTNFERIKNFNQAETKEFINRVRENPLCRYIDWNAWFDSEKEDFIFLGTDAMMPVPGSKKIIPCRVIGDRRFFSDNYKVVIANGKIMSVPADKLIFPEVTK